MTGGYTTSVFVALIALANSVTLGFAQGEQSENMAPDTITFQWCGNGENSQVENSDQLASRVIQIPENISEEREEFKIRLKEGNVSCPSGVNSEYLTLNLSSPASEGFSTNFSSNGYLRVGNYYYPPERFCITSWTWSEVEVRVCGEVNEEGDWSFPECGATNPCLPKCCAMNQLMTYVVGEYPKCLPKFNNSSRLNPILYTKQLQKNNKKTPVYYYEHKLKGQVHDFVHSKIQIEQEGLYFVNKICFRLEEDGTLLYLNHYTWTPVNRSSYCFDGIQLFNSSDSDYLFQGKEGQYGFMVKYIPVSPRNPKAYPILYATAFLSSSIFLLLTFLVYALLWQDQKIQGWVVMSHSATMFFMYVCSGTTNVFELLKRSDDPTRTPLCIAFASLTHFFYLSNFCWLTVTCFSFYWTFREITAVNPYSRNHGLYCLYVLFGWGLPAIFVTVSLVLDQIFSYDLCNEVLVPKYGAEACFVYEGSLGPYVIYPVALLLFLNVALFSVTVYNLYTYQKGTKIVRRNLDDTNKLLKLIGKLFFVMGFTWIFEFIGWIFAGVGRTCKSSIAVSLRKRYPILIPLLNIRSAIRSSVLGQETGLLELSSQRKTMRFSRQLDAEKY